MLQKGAVERGDSPQHAYRRWNEAIASEVFTPELAGSPVYLDLDPDVLSRIAARAGAGDGEPDEQLSSIVGATLRLDRGPADVFRAHQEELDVWRELNFQTLEPPPVLGVLAVLSLAAEAMGTGEALAPHNYYGQLARLLHVTDDVMKAHLTTACRRVAEDFWSSLNLWVDAGEGTRGVPTAYSLGAHRYIGLPLSQALVRADDRRRLRTMFARAGLAAGQLIGEAEMELVIDEWVADELGHSSRPFRALWRRADDDLRGRIASVAAVELEAWEGREQVLEGQPTSASGSPVILLTAIARTGLARRIDFGVLLRAEGSPRDFEVLSPSGETLDTIPLVPDANGWMRAADASALEPESVLTGEVRLRDPVSGTTYLRRARALYVLLRDEATGLYVERDRVALGADALVLASARLAPRVADALDALARPGYRAWLATDMPGLAAAWRLFTAVQVLAIPSPEQRQQFLLDLNPLLPVAVSQVTIADGLLIPGLVRKWSSLAPPEVRATSEDAERLEVRVERVRALHGESSAAGVTFSADSGIIVANLRGAGLPDGDYDVLVRENGRREPSQRRTLRLRSADSPAIVGVDSRDALAHDLGDDLLGPLSATNRVRSAVQVQGARLRGEGRLDDREGPPEPAWPAARLRRDTPPARWEPIRLGVVDPASCLYTGAHVIQLPPADGGRATGMIFGRCVNCGLEKRYPAGWHGAGRSSGRRARRPGRPERWTLPPLTDDGVSWSAALDAVCHVGGGAVEQLERVALQLEPTRLFASRFIRTLEALGHVDVMREPTDLSPLSWATTPTTLAELMDGSWLLVGWRGPDLCGLMSRMVEDLGGRLTLADAAAVPRVVVSELDAENLREIADGLSSASGRDVGMTSAAGASLASMLPPLSSVISALPRGTVPSARRVRRWDATVARWVDVRRADSPGSFQFRGYSTRYGIRSEADLADGSMAVADARVARYAGALAQGTSLVAFDEPTQLLVVPLGANLPGLYERAAVLTSGWPPQPDESRGVLLYRDVPRLVARTLMRLVFC